MRNPQTWFDKSLLEDEPFLSAFKERQLAAPPTPQIAGSASAGEDHDDNTRNFMFAIIAKDLMDMKLVSLVIPYTLKSNFTGHS